MTAEPDRELAVRALEWCKRNDGGRLYATIPDNDQPGIVVLWDNGGEDTLGYLYEGNADTAELICDLANWAVDHLVPSTVTMFGTRTYRAEVTE